MVLKMVNINEGEHRWTRKIIHDIAVSNFRVWIKWWQWEWMHMHNENESGLKKINVSEEKQKFKYVWNTSFNKYWNMRDMFVNNIFNVYIKIIPHLKWINYVIWKDYVNLMNLPWYWISEIPFHFLMYWTLKLYITNACIRIMFTFLL